VAPAVKKTVRFTNVVERSGEPQVHTLWVPPEKDPELQRAQKAHRVMTIERPASGGKTDVGFVGFDASPAARNKNAQYLIFPKSLKRFEGARVVGIKFDLVSQPKLASADRLKHFAEPTPKARGKKSAWPPANSVPTKKSGPKTDGTQEDEGAKLPQVIPFAPPPVESKRAKEPALAARAAAVAETKVETAATTPAAEAGKATRREAALLREVRAAMKELQRGKSVAAYQRLERAVSKAES
jgi:hypothetical protein